MKNSIIDTLVLLAIGLIYMDIFILALTTLKF